MLSMSCTPLPSPLAFSPFANAVMQSDHSSEESYCLSAVAVKFDKNGPYTTTTLLISVSNSVISQEIKEGEPIKWLGRIDCTSAETCTLKLYKKWNNWFPRLLACVDIPLQGLMVMTEPYIFAKDGLEFTLTFSLSVSQRGTITTSSRETPECDPAKHEISSASFGRIGENVESAKVAANDQNVLLGLLGNARDAAELVGSLGLAAGEVNPYAKAATSALETLAKLFEKQEDCYKATKEVVKELKEFLQIKEQVLELQDRKEIKITVERILELIAYISDYISEHATTRNFGDVLSSKLKDKVEEFKKEFARAKDSFDQSVDLDILKTAHALAQQFQLQRLRPVEALYQTGEDRACLEGTRRSLLNRAMFWLSQSPEQMFWVFGLAGSGKSAVANTIAMIISLMDDIDLTCYFCKRDDPVLSKAERFIPTIASLIARKHSGYRARLIDVLSSSDGIPLGDIQKQYDLLIGDLLPGVADPLRTHAIVVDALDECGLPADQKILAECILSLVKNVPWIKVLVTSRPEPEIRDIFTSHCQATDINQEAETLTDIELFTRKKLKELKLTIYDDKVDALVQRAGGLFIWCDTLFKYLGTSRNAKRDMRNFLSGTAKQDPLLQLYQLYDQILTSVVDMGHSEVREVLHAILGIIYVCSGNRRLSAKALASFLQHDSRFVNEDLESISTLTCALRAVIYEETNAYKTLRVYHPSFLGYLKRKLTEENGFILDLSAIHELMASGCLAIMHEELKFNICCIENSSRLNKDIQDLGERVSKYISEALQYSSLYWFNHISQSNSTTSTSSFIRLVSLLIMSPYILYWLEVLSWLDALGDGLIILRKGSTFFKTLSGDSACMLSDMERFVMAYGGAMESAPHVYLSTLAWLPEGTIAHKTLSSTFAHLPIVMNKESTWDAARWSKNISSKVRSVAYAPNGQCYTAGDENGSVRVWDVETCREIHCFNGHSARIMALAFSPDGRWLSGSTDDTVRIWDLATGEIAKIWESNPGVTVLTFSPDSTRIASGSVIGRMRLWEVGSGRAIINRFISWNTRAYSITFSADGERVFSGSETLQAWDARAGARISELGKYNLVPLLACSQDGKYIAAGLQVESKHAIELWDAQTYTSVAFGWLFDDDKGTFDLSFTTDSKDLYLLTNDCIRIWSMETFALTKRMNRIPRIDGAKLSPDLRSILVYTDVTVTIFDIQSEAAGESPDASFGAVVDVAVSSDERCIVSCHEESCYIHVWDAETGAKVIEPLRGHRDLVNSIAFSNNGRWLVSGSNDHSIMIWDVSFNWACGEPLVGDPKAVHAVVVSPDSRLIASHLEGDILCIWDIDTRLLLRTFDGIKVNCHASFFPDSRHIAVASRERGGKILDVSTGESKLRFTTGGSRVTSIKVSPNGKRMALAAGLVLFLADTTRSKKKLLELCNPHYVFLFSPFGRHLLVLGLCNDLEFWNAETGTLDGTRSLRCIGYQITRISFSPDYKRIILITDDGAIRVCENWVSISAHRTLLEGNHDVEEAEHPDLEETIRRLRWGVTCSKMGLTDGWIKDDGGKLLMWVPEQYRDDIVKGQKLVIANGRDRVIRPTIDYKRLLIMWVRVGRESIDQMVLYDERL